MYRGLMIVAVLDACCLTTVGAIRCYVTKDLDGNMKEVDCSKVDGAQTNDIISDIADDIGMTNGGTNGMTSDVDVEIGGLPKWPHHHKRTASNKTMHNATADVKRKTNAMETCGKVAGTVRGTLLHE